MLITICYLIPNNKNTDGDANETQEWPPHSNQRSAPRAKRSVSLERPSLLSAIWSAQNVNMWVIFPATPLFGWNAAMEKLSELCAVDSCAQVHLTKTDSTAIIHTTRNVKHKLKILAHCTPLAQRKQLSKVCNFLNFLLTNFYKNFGRVKEVTT